MAVAANFEAMPRVDQIRVDYFAANYRSMYEGATFANVLDLKVKVAQSGLALMLRFGWSGCIHF